MKTHKYISALLVMVASALLSSCSLLVSSPIHSYRPRPYYASAGERPLRSPKVCKRSFQVPVDGGVYEFDCANDQFSLPRIFDTSMLMQDAYTDSRYSPATDDYASLDGLSYDGAFYTITCDLDEHKWTITVDPLMATPGEFSYREVWVCMWDESDGYKFVFQFEQNDDDNDSFGGVE